MVSVFFSESSCAPMSYQEVMLAACMFPKGLGAFVMDPITGLSTGPFSTRRFRDIMNQDPTLFKDRGIESITQNVLDADREMCDKYVLEAIRQRLVEDGNRRIDCVLVCRILKPLSTEYRWVRQWTLPGILPDDRVVLSGCNEIFDHQARCILESLAEERSLKMLSALSQMAYDCCLWTDERLRILSDTRNCRKWILGNSTRSLINTPLESFLPFDHNKLALRQYFKAVALTCLSPIRLRMNVKNRTLVEVDIWAFKVDNKYIVGLNSVDTGDHQPVERVVAPRLVKKNVTIPFDVPSRIIDNFHESSQAAVISDMYRGLISSLAASLDACCQVGSWEVPAIRTCSSTESEANFDCVVGSLPPQIQKDFLDASERLDYHSCCQMLSFTVCGDANILASSATSISRLTDNSDLLNCVFAFLTDMVPRLNTEPNRQDILLNSLQDGLKRLDHDSYIPAAYRFAIVLLSTASVNPPDPVRLLWLRSTFINTLALPIGPNRDSQLLVSYWVCFLWASAMHAVGTERRIEEALAVLENIINEIEGFETRYPFSSVATRLGLLAHKNLNSS